MRRQVPVHQQLYAFLFPNPSHSDPPNFTAHLARDLVPEVRIEVATFYGDLNSVEARYPGLDYCFAPHRLRLGRFKHHRRLFEAFEELGLTEQEIQDLCCWEGSKWARQKYEEDQGVKVVDTTGNDIKPWKNPRHMTPEERSRQPPSRKLRDAKPILEGELLSDDELEDEHPEAEEIQLDSVDGINDRAQPMQIPAVASHSAHSARRRGHFFSSNVQSEQTAPSAAATFPPTVSSTPSAPGWQSQSSIPAPLVGYHSSGSTSTVSFLNPSIAGSRGDEQWAAGDRLRNLQRHVLQAFRLGQEIPPEIEAMVKHHVERGELPEEFYSQARRLSERHQALRRHDGGD